LYFKSLAVNINMGEAFRLNGVVDYLDSESEKGFVGEGMVQIQGLPTMAASFGFCVSGKVHLSHGYDPGSFIWRPVI
jgi:hypothetical protein